MGVTSHHPAPGIQDRGAAAQLPEILGGFRDEPWDKHPMSYGSSRSFLGFLGLGYDLEG